MTLCDTKVFFLINCIREIFYLSALDEFEVRSSHIAEKIIDLQIIYQDGICHQIIQITFLRIR